MALVLIADDAYLFMVSWESMALSSFFLVTTDHRIPKSASRFSLPADRTTSAPSRSFFALVCCRVVAAITRSGRCARWC
jgi:NADH:ubiquinone oxidoreductase subunit 5 (subunit L)/multisubunit Na+/H+ antiporter MnhA subunit